MKQFWTVLRFELRGYGKNKVFMGLTIALVLVIGVLLSFPRFTGGGEAETPQAPDRTLALAGAAETPDIAEMLAGYTHAQVTPVEGDEQTLKALVDAGEYDAAVLMEDASHYVYITRSIGMYDEMEYTLQAAMQQIYRTVRLAELGVDPEAASDIVLADVTGRTVTIQGSQMDRFFYTYILIFALYMAIVLYGQLVATSIATEKGSRAMEMLITSARPLNLMFGKVLGSGLAGLIQFAAIFGSGFLFYNLNRTYWADNAIISSIFDMPLDILGYALLFFVLGYFLYAFLYGALGSLASRSEDINTLSLPITFFFIAAFAVVMTSLGSGDMESPLLKVCSFLPFTSPMAMFTRIAMGQVPGLEIGISVGILFVSTILVGYLSAVIYRVGVLLYGKPPKWSEIHKIVKANR